MLGLEFSQERPGSAVGWELGLMASGDESTSSGIDVEGATAEVYGGVRKSFGSGSLRPVIGGGLSAIAAAVEHPIPGNARMASKSRGNWPAY